MTKEERQALYERARIVARRLLERLSRGEGVVPLDTPELRAIQARLETGEKQKVK